jgi:hypothetical protein
VLDDAARGTLQRVYEAGRVDADSFVAARRELLLRGRYMWGSVQTVRGCPSIARSAPSGAPMGRRRDSGAWMLSSRKILELRRRGFRFVALADDNFYPGHLSKLYRQMYANTGIVTDSARVNRANRWARLIARPCRHLFTARPLPDLQLPAADGGAGVRVGARG